MIELPELVMPLIYRQLSHEDIQNLGATCQRLKEMVDQRKCRSLNVFVESFPFERELLYTGELIGYANSLHVRELDILKSPKFKSHFSGLFKFHLYSPGRDLKNVDLNDLNCYEKLVHLEVHGLVLVGEKLSLPNLKVALFENKTEDPLVFELDCPRLEALGLKQRAQADRIDRQLDSTSLH